MAAGREAVAARGFAGLVVREIAREAGIVPTAFYRHFDSLDALATELAAGSAAELARLVDTLVGAPAADPPADWPPLVADAAAAAPQTWTVLARGLVATAHPDHATLSDAVDTARRRVGITLGRLEALAGASGDAVDVAADLVVVDLLRLALDVASGRDARAATDESGRRLRVVLAGTGAG